MNKNKGLIKKSLSLNNINDFSTTPLIPKVVYTSKEIFKMIDNYRHMYCPVCKNKNKGIVYYMALDMIFCSEFCRQVVCSVITFQDIDDRKYFRKKFE
jgi:hypothetical protein